MAMRQPLDLRRNEYIETRFVQQEPPYPVLTATLGMEALLAGGWIVAALHKPNRHSMAAESGTD